MPEYLHPGVYVEETSFRGKPIQGVSTSTAGYVGAAARGPEKQATFVPSYAAFQRIFGEPISPPVGLGDYLGYSVKAFFENGGARCYVVRVLPEDAASATTTLNQGTVLRLAPGVTARGPTREIRLSALRGVAQNVVLQVHVRASPDAPFFKKYDMTVESYDALRNTVTVALASALPAGAVLDPANTIIRIGADPAAGGPRFEARHRGVDGDNLAIEIRARDRQPVALTAVTLERGSPQLVVLAPAAAGTNTLQFDVASLKRLRAHDRITIGANQNLEVTTIAEGDVNFSFPAGGSNHSAGGPTIALVQRGAALGAPLDLGAAPPAFSIDMSAGAGASGVVALPHALAALLKAGDVVRVTSGGSSTDVTITQVRVAEEVNAGQHVTVGAPLQANVAADAQAQITAASADAPARIFVADTAGLAVPQRAGSLESLALSDGAAADTVQIALVDPSTGQVFLAGAAPAQATNLSWRSAEALTVAAAGDVTVRVANAAAFYTGAVVELDDGQTKTELLVQSVDKAARTVTFTTPVTNAITVPADAAARKAFLRVSEIDVAVWENNTVIETFEGLTWNPDASTDAGLRFYADRINDNEAGSRRVKVALPAPGGTQLANAPTTANGVRQKLSGGSNGTKIKPTDLVGDDKGPGERTGIQALTDRDDISMVAAPGVTDQTVQNALLTHAELMRYRIAVLDAPVDAKDVTSIQAHRNRYDSKYAAYYAPWLRAMNPRTGRIESFPPSGYAMGICARTDNTAGVHKAPANEVVRNIVDVTAPLSAAEQDVLNPAGVNLIRDLTPRGIRLWGARTISSDPEWKYLNVRRLFNFVEHSIDLGTQWVTFEGNSEALWARVKETVSSFLFGVWKSGALMGVTPEEGFFVTCDRTTMTQDDLDNGRLVCLIGLAPVYPAEFVIFRIGQFTAKSGG
jgi:phage tail sheath protein FI